MNIAVLYGIAAGVCVAVIGPLNAGLQGKLGLWGMNAWVHLIGFAFCMVVLVSTRSFVLQANTRIPWYSYFGGVVGSLIVVFTVLGIIRLGVSSTLVLTIGSQLVLAAVIDHFGLLGQARAGLTDVQVVGLLLVVAGSYLVVARPSTNLSEVDTSRLVSRTELRVD